MGNVGILAIGAILIVAVLFIGYKMDTASSRTQARKAEKAAKAKKSKRDEEEYEYTEKEEADIYSKENLYDMQYESDDNESYESDYVSQIDLAEENEYEEDDISLFEKQSADEYTFNNDIDDELAFETYDTDNTASEYEEVPEDEGYEEVDFDVELEPEIEIEPEPEPEKPKKTRGRPKKNKSVEEESPKATKGRKSKKVVEPEPEEDYSTSTMIFDVDKLNAEIDSLDEDYTSTPRESEIEYSDAVDIDAKISELDDDETYSEPVDGPIKPVEEDAESFMDKINKMKEAATSVNDFSGFSVDTKDEELRATHKKYTKKKTEEEINLMSNNQISFMQNEVEEPRDEVDVGFLAEMEKTLKQNQKDRMTKNKKKKDE